MQLSEHSLRQIDEAYLERLGDEALLALSAKLLFLNDREAVFCVLEHPFWPLTNNEAERALWHWVILRQISHGTRPPQGSRHFALLASVIDTCRRRGHSPWESPANRHHPPTPRIGSLAAVAHGALIAVMARRGK